MAMSPTDPIGLAWNRMVLVLFKPFNLGKWLMIGFCAFLAYMGQGGGGLNFNPLNPFRQLNYFTAFHQQPTPGFTPPNANPPPALGQFQPTTQPGAVTPQTYPVLPGAGPPVMPTPFPPPPNPFAFLAAHVTLFVVLGIGIVVLVLVLTIVLLWLHARGRFMFIHCLATNRDSVIEPWKQFRGEANSLFKFEVMFTLIGFVVFIALAALGLAIAWPDIQHQTFGGPAVAAIIITGLLFLLMTLVSIAVNSLVNYLIVPGMYARQELFWPTWRAVREEILRPHLATVALFIFLRWLVAFGAIAAMSIVSCCTCSFCCCGSLPYLSSVIYLPVLVFLECCALYFVNQAGGRWRIFKPDPDAPTCPSCGYDLRGNPAADSCPECGRVLPRDPLEIIPAEPA